MKKPSSCASLQSCIATAGLFLASLASAREIHVAKTGNDNQTGEPSAPLLTIQRAAQLAQAGDVVLIHQGTYRETVVPKNSGTAEAPITFAPWHNELVVVSGAEPVRGWREDAKGVYVTELPGDFFHSSMNQALQVFVDERMMMLAQWPNTTLDVSYPAKSSLTRFISKSRQKEEKVTVAVFEDDKLEPAEDGFYEGCEIFLQPNYQAWSWALTGTVSKQEGKRLTIRSRSDAGKDHNHGVYDPRSRYVLYNKRELLDAPGEWFHDRAAEKLYLKPPDGDNPARHAVEVKKRDYAFNLSERSHIIIKGLHLFAATITTDTAAGGDGRGYDEKGNVRYPWRGKGSVARSSYITIDGIQARYLNHFTDRSGHFFFQWGTGTGFVLSGTDHVLQNSVIQYSAGNGITLLGRRHKVLNNALADLAYSGVDCAGVNTGGAAETLDHEIAHNTIVRCGRSGITPRGLGNSEPTRFAARIHHNDISWCMLQDWDGAGIYWAGSDSKWLRLDHNFVHDNYGFIVAGIYPDFCKNIIIDHNVVWNCDWAIHIQGAFNASGEGQGTVNNTLVYHNTLVCLPTTDTGWGPFDIGGGASQNTGTVIANNILSIRHPERAKKYASPYTDNFKNARRFGNLEWDTKPNSATDPKFVDPEHANFQLQPNSPAIDGVQTIGTLTYEEVAMPEFQDAYHGKAPDAGAFEFGAKPWTAGASLPEAARFLREGGRIPGDRR